MTHPVSERFIRESQAAQSGDVFLVLLEITHASLGQPIRLVADNAGVQHGGAVYAPSGFQIALPEETPDGPVPEVRLAISNVDRAIIGSLRQLTGPMRVDVLFVLRSQPEVIERSLRRMKAYGVSYDEQTITASISTAPVFEGPASRDQFSPSVYPGLEF